MRILAMQDGTNVTITRGTTNSTIPLNQGEVYSQQIAIVDRTNPQIATRYVTSDKPILVCLFSSSAGANGWLDIDEQLHSPGDPSMTLIPPLEFMMDTTIFYSYNGGTGTLEHRVNLWALTSHTNTIRLDGNSISGWQTLAANSSYSQTSVVVNAGNHTLTAPEKCFSGYAYGINDGQAYMYPVGYDFTPQKDTLFLLDNSRQYDVHHDGAPSEEWKANYVSNTEGGWFLDKVLQNDDTYLLDSTFVCDSTILDFPIKTYNAWYKTVWEIEGSIQGRGYFTPI